jgi:putative addiction module component (TIGR02574 family)
MPVTLQEWKAQLGSLPEPERAELAHFLLDTLDAIDADAEAAWDTELGRRAEEIRSGTASGKPADQVFAKLRETHA